MGILTALYRVNEEVFLQFDHEERLQNFLDMLVELGDEPATFDQSHVGLDKSWYEFERIFKELLPPRFSRIFGAGMYPIRYRGMDVNYWISVKRVGLLSVLAEINEQDSILSSDQLEAALIVLKEKMIARAAEEKPWTNDRGYEFTTVELDYVYSHICRAARFLVNVWEEQPASVIIRVSS